MEAKVVEELAEVKVVDLKVVTEERGEEATVEVDTAAGVQVREGREEEEKVGVKLEGRMVVGTRVEVVMVEVVMEATVRAVLTVLMGLVLRAAMWGGPPRCAGAGARSHEVAGRRNLLAG